MDYEKIEPIQECKYNLNGTLFFETAHKKYAITQKDALEIAFTLIDSLNLPYSILEDVEIKVNCDE